MKFVGPPQRYNRPHTNIAMFKRCDFCSFPVDVIEPEIMVYSKDGKYFVLLCDYCCDRIKVEKCREGKPR